MPSPRNRRPGTAAAALPPLSPALKSHFKVGHSFAVILTVRDEAQLAKLMACANDNTKTQLFGGFQVDTVYMDNVGLSYETLLKRGRELFGLTVVPAPKPDKQLLVADEQRGG
jgi:hypothetical protein